MAVYIPSMIVALLVAVLMAGLFGLVLRRPGPWGGVFWMFLVVFLVAWAVGMWVPPVGPLWMGVSWVPFLIAALVVTLLIAAAAEPREPATVAEAEEAEAAAVAAGVLFWSMLLVLVVLVIAGGVLSV